jgi:hypothetical protein
VIRAVLAVAVATALLGVAIPALEDARSDRSARLVRGEVAAIERAADSLLAADETAPSRGARRVVDVSLPEGSWSNADVDELGIRGSAGTWRNRSTVRYRVDGGSSRSVEVDAPLYTPDGVVDVPGDGTSRVVLELVRVEGRPAVAVRVSGPRSSGRGFMTESGTTPSHVHPRQVRRAVGGVWV